MVGRAISDLFSHDGRRSVRNTGTYVSSSHCPFLDSFDDGYG